MKKEGYRESTIVSRVKLLAGLAKKANLLDPESVTIAVARLNVTEGRKENTVCVCGSFCRQNRLPFNPPKYHRIERLPFIPSESEVDQLIAGLGGKTTTFLQTIKETAGHPGGVWRLGWLDLDLEGQTIPIAPEKKSNPQTVQSLNQTGLDVESPTQEEHSHLRRRRLRQFQPLVLHEEARVGQETVKPPDGQDRLQDPPALEGLDSLPSDTRHRTRYEDFRTQGYSKHAGLHPSYGQQRR